MSTVLQQAEALARQRSEEQAARNKALRDRIRKMVVAIVTETDPPGPNEILEACDQLKVGIEWFENAVDRCRARVADVQASQRVPGLKTKLRQLEGQVAQLKAKAEEAELAKDRAFDNIKSPTPERGGMIRMDATEGELADFRSAHAVWMEACHQEWLVARDIAELQREIIQLEQIDTGKRDLESSEPSPFDFILPPLR